MIASIQRNSASDRLYGALECYNVDVVVIIVGRGPPPRRFYTMVRYPAR